MNTMSKLFIKNITIKNFKGVKNSTFDFSEYVNVTGKNGSGKTTVFDAVTWLLFDKDSKLNSNPNVAPIGVEECTPTVTLYCDIDGEKITLAKMQKRTVKPLGDGVTKVSVNNTYEINSVQKTERDFKAKLEEIGLCDSKKLILLTNIDVFTGSKSTEMRDILFSMASEKSDLDIASEFVPNLVDHLKIYSLDEVIAMQKSTKRKVAENYGKSGEILRAKIEGMEATKKEVRDKKAVLDDVEECKNAIIEIEQKNAEMKSNIEAAHDKLMKLKFDEQELINKLTADTDKHNRDIELKIAELENTNSNIKSEISLAEYTIKSNEQGISDYKKEFENQREYYNINKEKQYSNNYICPCCGQKIHTDKIEQAKKHFEEEKEKKLNEINEFALRIKNEIEKIEISTADFKKEHDKLQDNFKKNEAEICDLRNKLLPSVDLSSNENLIEIRGEIERTKAIVDNGCIANSDIGVRNTLSELGKELLIIESNERIDEQIEDMKNKQIVYEQQLADADRILYQIDLLNKKKIELLTDEINSHFEIVDFKLFDYQKDGQFKEVCIPLIDGKRFGESTNTGREVLAKIDIVAGLQKFNNIYMPIFVDNAECLSEETRNRVKTDTQMIYLSVSEKDLEVQNENG